MCAWEFFCAVRGGGCEVRGEVRDGRGVEGYEWCEGREIDEVR